MRLNPELLAAADRVLRKRAFVPGTDPVLAAQQAPPPGAPPMDPSMMGGGGMPPMDPAMMGGGGMPPMDPSMMGGGGMPMDPSMMGGGMPPMDPSMMGGGMPPGDPAAGGAPPPEESSGPEMGGSGILQALQQGQAQLAGTPGKYDPNYQSYMTNVMLGAVLDKFDIKLPASVVFPQRPPAQPKQDGSGQSSGGGQ